LEYIAQFTNNFLCTLGECNVADTVTRPIKDTSPALVNVLSPSQGLDYLYIALAQHDDSEIERLRVDNDTSLHPVNFAQSSLILYAFLFSDNIIAGHIQTLRQASDRLIGDQWSILLQGSASTPFFITGFLSLAARRRYFVTEELSSHPHFGWKIVTT